MKKNTIGFLFVFLTLGISLEGFLRYNRWEDRNIVQGWGQLKNLKSGSSFKQNQTVVVQRADFKTNSSGERDEDHSSEKLKSDIRIGVFGGLNVLGFTLSKQKTLSEYMKINPAPTCELQGRNCVYFSYGRIDFSSSETAKLIEEKLKTDALDIVIWIVDPFIDATISSNVPWTPSLALNWILAPLSWKSLQKDLTSPGTATNHLPEVLPSIRQIFITSQKDLIPVVMPAMDRDIASQNDWEVSNSATFFNNGFLPLRAKSLIQEKTRTSLALKGTGLMDEEALRALASLIRERVEKSPQMKAHY